MSDLESKAKPILLKLCNKTKITEEMLEFMKAEKLIVDTEYQKVQNLLDNKSDFKAASFLYNSILPKLSEDQENIVFEALEIGGNRNAILLLNPDYTFDNPGSDDKTSNTNVKASKKPASKNAVQAVEKLKADDQPDSSRKPRSSDSYKHGQRFALICNVTFKREGCEEDETELADLLMKDNFDVKVLTVKERTDENILKNIKKFIAKVVDYGSVRVGGIFVAIMSHGNDKDEFQTENDKLLSVKTIIDLFHHSKFSSLLKIPKVFLLNMCRGKQFQLHTDGDEEVEFDWKAFIKNNFKPTPPGSLEADIEDSDNDFADELGDDQDTWMNLCILVSTVEGHLTYRKNPFFGGRAWFVEDFCSVLRQKIENCQPTDIAIIYEETKTRVESRSGRLKNDPKGTKRKQTPYMAPIRFDKQFLLPAPKQ